MIKNTCGQNNVPTTDNTGYECDENGFTDTNCVVFTDAITYLNLPSNSTMTDVVNNLLLSLIDARNRITILEQ